MTGHTGFGGRHPGEFRLVDRRVAVATIEAKLPDVVQVAEGHRLVNSHTHVGHKWCLHKEIDRPTKHSYQKYSANNRNPGDGIHTWVKNIIHKHALSLCCLLNNRKLSL
jgi:hypothetical protein